MSSIFWGEKVKISIFGESHSSAIGVTIDSLPAGEYIDLQKVYDQMKRRLPGNDPTSTPRKEADIPNVICGLFNEKTTGAPLTAIIENTNTKSHDYGELCRKMRPSHADYPAFIKFCGNNDIRGGGHFSGRLTAPLVFAGAVIKQILERRGITIGSHIYSIKDVFDTPFDLKNTKKAQLELLNNELIPLNDKSKEAQMKTVILNAKDEHDSVGGIVECCILGLDAGNGSPMFSGVENVISSIIFGIPAVKGIEFGNGFSSTLLNGSENNDPYYYDNGKVKTKTNNSGGIIGGITNGMPVIFRVAFKPTASIGKEQQTVDIEDKIDTSLSIVGRHDPCIVLRAAVCVEAAAAVAAINLI